MPTQRLKLVYVNFCYSPPNKLITTAVSLECLQKKCQINHQHPHSINPVNFGEVLTSFRSVHWLPVKQQVEYKLATLIYKSLWGQAPPYLANDCQLIELSGRPWLCSAHASVLTVPRTNTRLSGRSFAVVGPRVWNSLPASLRQPDIELSHFKRHLKAFCLARPWRISDTLILMRRV